MSRGYLVVTDNVVNSREFAGTDLRAVVEAALSHLPDGDASNIRQQLGALLEYPERMQGVMKLSPDSAEACRSIVIFTGIEVLP